MAYDFEQFNKEIRAIRAETRELYKRIENIAGTIENPTDDRTMDIMVQALRRAPGPTVKIHRLILPNDRRVIKGSDLWDDWVERYMVKK